MDIKVKLSEEDIEAIVDRLMQRLDKKPAEELVPREDYATMLGVQPQTISRYFDQGRLKGKRIARRLYIYKNQEHA